MGTYTAAEVPKRVSSNVGLMTGLKGLELAAIH